MSQEIAMVDVQELDKLIEEQLNKLQEVIDRLPDRVIHKTIIGDPSVGSTILTLRAIQEALRGNDWILRTLAEITPPLMP